MCVAFYVVFDGDGAKPPDLPSSTAVNFEMAIYENQTDPFTGKSDGILARCTASNTCPKVIHLNSGTTSIALQGVNPAMPKGVCAMPFNLTDYRPHMRGARWSRSTAGSRTLRPPRPAAIRISPMARWCPR
jgi:hypothetical protein